MGPKLKRGCRGLVFAVAALLIVWLALGCSDLPGTGTTIGAATTIVGDTTTLPPGETTTVPEGVTTTTAAPVTTLAPATTLAPGTTLPPAVTVTTAPLSSAEELLPNGHIKAMGFISDVWMTGGGSVRHLRIDYAEMLTGADALAAFNAAKAAGREPADATLDTDFYISNVNPLMREFVISNSVAITSSTRWAPHDGMGAPCSWADFYNFWNLVGPPVEGDSQMSHVPWWIERDGNTVVKLDEQYLP